MRFACVLLVTAFSAVTHAQPTDRCDNRVTNGTRSSAACVAPPATKGVAVSEADRAGAPSSFFLEAPADALGDWNTRDSMHRLPWTHAQELAMVRRLRAHQKVSNERQEAQYAENRRRCASALRIATLCGKHAGTFYCDDKGFQAIPEDKRVKLDVLNRGDRYRMEHCALEAARNGF